MKKLCLIAFIITICGIISSCSSTKEVDLMQFATVNFSGLDGEGLASLNVDWSGFKNEITTDEALKNLDKSKILSDLEDYIEYSIDKTDGLSNGDIVNIYVAWDNDAAKKLKLKFSGETTSAVVKDLKTLIAIDLFQDIYIDFSSVSPYATASLRNASSDAFLKSVSYSMNNTKNLSNGDTITVTAKYSEADALSYGYKISETQKQYTVSNVDEYITSQEKVDEDSFAIMKSDSDDFIEANLAKDSSAATYLYPNRFVFYEPDHTILEQKLAKTYFLTLKKGAQAPYGTINALYLVYEIRFTGSKVSDSSEQTIYWPIQFRNIIQHPDGSIELSDRGRVLKSATTLDGAYREHIAPYKADYDFSETDY